MTTSMPTRGMQFHKVNDNGTLGHTRVPYPGGQFNRDRHFHAHEESQFLNHFLSCPYGVLVGEAMGQQGMLEVTHWMEEISRYGLRGRSGQAWRFLYGYWTDHGRMIMVPANSGIRSLDQIGIKVLKAKTAPKRLKRVFAPARYWAAGRILDSTLDPRWGEVSCCELENGYRFLHRNISLDSLTDEQRAIADGQLGIAPRFLANAYHLTDNLNTWAGKFTIFNDLGVGKGFGHARRQMDDGLFDIVTYGAKKDVTFAHVYTSVLDELHPGAVPRTDMQSMLNFHEYEVAFELAQSFFNTVVDGVKDEEGLRRTFLRFLGDVKNADGETWCLIEAFKAGISPLAEPGLFRRVVNHLMTKIMECEQGRIPMDGHAIRADIVPDPHMFDENGDIRPENTVVPRWRSVCMDAPVGPTADYRNPSGHALEYSKVINYHDRRFRHFAGLQRNFVGRDLATYLLPQNGADLDDTSMKVFNPKLVNLMYNLSYPVTNKLSEFEEPKTALNVYLHRLQGKTLGGYTAEEFIEAMDMAREFSIKIGQIVNLIMLDTALSGEHREHMLAYLREALTDLDPHGYGDSYGGGHVAFMTECINWLANREDYQAREAATNLEALIDFTQQGKGDPAVLGPIVDRLMQIGKDTKVYPRFWAMPGTGFMGQGRIPSSKKEGVDFLLAPTKMCLVLEGICAERKKLQEAFTSMQWKCVTPVADDLDQLFPHDPDLAEIILEKRNEEWNPLMIEIMQGGHTDEERRKLHKKATQGLRSWLEEFTEDERMAIAVEAKRICHRSRVPKKDEHGKVRGVPDSFLWNDSMAKYYIMALEVAGLTGLYVPVDFDAVSRHLAKTSVETVVRAGSVFRRQDNFFIGLAMSVPDGEYNLNGGLLEVREPSPCITRDALAVDGSETMDNAIEMESADNQLEPGQDYTYTDSEGNEILMHAHEDGEYEPLLMN